MDLILLLQWWNLVYLLPFLFGFLVLLMQAAGLAGKDLDLSVEGDAHLELGAASDVAVDVDAEAEVAHDLVPIGEGHVELSLVWKAASLMGVGKVPLSVLMMSFCFTWGGFGLVLNASLRALFPRTLVFFPLSLVGTFLLSLFSTVLLSKFLVTFLPSFSSTSSRTKDLVGRIGRSMYRIRPGVEGVIRVDDQYGNQLQFSAFHEGTMEIAGETEVLLVRFDSEKKAFEVELAPEELRQVTLES
jgi:membrane protein implicated in regulation of membrane protease activity